MRPIIPAQIVTGAVALALAPPAAAGPAVYGGKLPSAGDAIVLTADAHGRQLKSAVLSWSAKCSDGSPISRFVYHESPGLVAARGKGAPPQDKLVLTRNAGGVFRGQLSGISVQTDDTTYAVTLDVSGKLTPTGASGTLSATVVIGTLSTGPNPPTSADVRGTCDTGTLRWTAARKPGIVYAGSTAQDEPVVVRLAANRLSVAEIVFGWNSDCSDGSRVDFPEDFTKFPLSATGAFADTFSQQFPVDTGGNNVFDYQIAGKVKRRSASGTFGAKVTWADGTTCGTGPTRWVAATG